MQVDSKIAKQIQNLLENTIILDRKYLDDEQLDKDGQFQVLKEIFDIDVRDKEIKEFFPDRIEEENFFFPEDLSEWKQEVCKPVVEAGFTVNSIDEYKEKDLYTDTATLMDIIEMVPLVTDFDREQDKHTIEELADKYREEEGFSTTWHYYIIVAQKP